MRTACLPALLLALTLPAWAGESSGDPLAALIPVAATEVSFTPGVPLLTPQSRERLRPVLAKSRDPGCYWIARGRNPEEAETLRAALAENDIAIEAIALDVKPLASFAEARLYCTPPPVLTAYFPPGTATLTEEARHLLSIAAASQWNSGLSLVVRGYAGAKESADPLKLGLDRALGARNFLIALGLAPKRLTVEANTKATGRDALRVEIMPGKS